MSWDKAAFERALLEAVIANANARYDAAVDLFATEARGIVYHSRIRSGTVHPTRDAFVLAGALLDHGGEEEAQRAFRVLRRVLTAQDTNPENKTYGIWPWFWEEPLPQMNPPDWNWADFCGQAIYFILRRHAARLPEDLRQDLTLALGHAARSIERRNMGPHYTNIAVLGTFVTMAASEYLGWEDLHEYAYARLKRFAAWTDQLGTFSEFNSPTYTSVTITALAQMLQFWQDPKARELAERVHYRAWEHLVAHWHAPTRQWAGPHSRCYTTDLRRNSHAQIMLQKATQGALQFYDPQNLTEGNWEVSFTDFFCPPELLLSLLTLREARQHRERFEPEDNNTGRIAAVGTTYLDPRFALGSCTRQNFWNQCRPLLMYWGDAGQAHSLRLQCLHDDFDFASGQFFSAQQKDSVLVGINFGNNGGDQHIHLDSIQNGRFPARDLRLRLEIDGAPEGCEKDKRFTLGEPLRLDLGDIQLWVCFPAAVFGTETPRCEIRRDGHTLMLDVVFYSGPQKEICWEEVGQAYAGMALSICNEPDALPQVTVAEQVRFDWQAPTAALRVQVDPALKTVGEQQASGLVWLNDAAMPAPPLSTTPLFSEEED